MKFIYFFRKTQSQITVPIKNKNIKRNRIHLFKSRNKKKYIYF
jgi:hypothetical protein